MRSNGLATILLLVPMLAVPALAIFGIPQFAPVVASPLDEGRDFDRESRVGNSARPAQDDLFDDLDGFGPETQRREDSSSDSRELASNSSRLSKGKRKPKKSAFQAWNDDLENQSDWSDNPPERNRSEDFNSQDIFDSANSRNLSPNTKRSGLASKKRTAADPGSTRQAKRDDALRLVSAVDVEPDISSAAYSESNDATRPPSIRFESQNRPGKINSRSGKRETPVENLTWQSAVERLNELEIRNFRLEPGHQSGQYVFICSYTPPNAPRVSYRFEAGADEPLKAVEKVLEQIVEWQQRR